MTHPEVPGALDLEGLERLESEASPAPWEIGEMSGDYADICVFMPDNEDTSVLTSANAAFVCAARTAVPSLIVEHRALLARVRRLEAVASAARDYAEMHEHPADAVGRAARRRLDEALAELDKEAE